MANAEVKPNQENQIKFIKRVLENWRMAIIPLKQIMLWERPWYPLVLFLMVSLLYAIIWVMDFNVLTNIAVLGLIVNFLDFTIPTLCKIIYGVNSWSGQKEQIFEDVCNAIIKDYNKVVNEMQSFYAMRDTNPLMYYFLSIILLGIMAWITSTINNLFLLYLLSLTLLFWPGIKNVNFSHILYGSNIKTKQGLKSQ